MKKLIALDLNTANKHLVSATQVVLLQNDITVSNPAVWETWNTNLKIEANKNYILECNLSFLINAISLTYFRFAFNNTYTYRATAYHTINTNNSLITLGTGFQPLNFDNGAAQQFNYNNIGYCNLYVSGFLTATGQIDSFDFEFRTENGTKTLNTYSFLKLTEFFN